MLDFKRIFTGNPTNKPEQQRQSKKTRELKLLPTTTHSDNPWITKPNLATSPHKLLGKPSIST